MVMLLCLSRNPGDANGLGWSREAASITAQLRPFVAAGQRLITATDDSRAASMLNISRMIVSHLASNV